MTTTGIIFMAVCWAGIIGFTFYFFYKTLTIPPNKE